MILAVTFYPQLAFLWCMTRSRPGPGPLCNARQGASFQTAQDGESATFSQVETYLVSHISHESQLNVLTVAIAYCIACDCALQTRRGSCVSSAAGRVGSATLRFGQRYRAAEFCSRLKQCQWYQCRNPKSTGTSSAPPNPHCKVLALPAQADLLKPEKRST